MRVTGVERHAFPSAIVEIGAAGPCEAHPKIGLRSGELIGNTTGCRICCGMTSKTFSTLT